MADITISGAPSLTSPLIGTSSISGVISAAAVQDDPYASSISVSGAPSLAYPTGGGIAIPTTGQIWPLGLTAR